MHSVNGALVTKLYRKELANFISTKYREVGSFSNIKFQCKIRLA